MNINMIINQKDKTQSFSHCVPDLAIMGRVAIFNVFQR
jgi:hypothetical protein